jgi:hypothetical protein
MHFKVFCSGFTELHANIDADTLLDYAIHRRQNKTRSRKSTRVKKCMFTAQCHVADWYNRFKEVWPSSLSSSSTMAVTIVTVRELSGTPRIRLVSREIILYQWLTFCLWISQKLNADSRWRINSKESWGSPSPSIQDKSTLPNTYYWSISKTRRFPKSVTFQ